MRLKIVLSSASTLFLQGLTENMMICRFSYLCECVFWLEERYDDVVMEVIEESLWFDATGAKDSMEVYTGTNIAKDLMEVYTGTTMGTIL